MTRDPRNDPAHDPGYDAADPDDQTRVVERQTYVERERPAENYTPPPANYANPTPAGSQVNVNADRGGAAYVDTSPGPLYYARRVLSLLFGILAVLLLLRIVFLLLVANQSNAIVDFVYAVTEPFVAPFRGIFNFDNVVVGDATLDIAALVALIGWFLIYLLIVAILSIGDRRTTA
jgi:uncharacterized protein YggT (Ycf19 family)